ncbi:MAG: DNA-directed RNA polymerase subunit alpha [Parcubacteria group bacterium Gr01-1014_18]|nr:MAG: DNA-directed RNA polymerase subunit alpha [Parcubacteria group bacterium Greene0416_36]TSC80135.1 MAG: DNA-directed RNA polymerase subunit alpha [Parcubacteria group bacterium Gr01-1014_18]TSC99349.1 MAG: DNA-directed RNA polymerase subunit alpha [Parcubacteria group bacterium Greene1014_20]TSD06814.1 MAG: DNA-directed RNA polymerase subunit alpha [Parcubacteria group bacterium Greene0714_2]
MSIIALPTKFNFIPHASDANRGTFTVEPCIAGYGTTLGNALRRVLLSSVPGFAVYGLKIKGVDHEFSTIPHVKEDVIEVILNFKQLRLKILDGAEARVTLTVSGEKEVYARDIDGKGIVEVGNPDLLLFTTTEKNAKVQIDILVNSGMGYGATENRKKEKEEVGVIAIDSIYTPLRNVGYKVENVRVGQMTNYEKLLLDVETDGTVNPIEALNTSLVILLDHFSLLGKELGAMKVETPKPAAKKSSAKGAKAAKAEKDLSGGASAKSEEIVG